MGNSPGPFIKELLGRKLRRSVSLKLIIAIGSLIFLGSAVFWVGFVIRGENKYLQLSIEHAKDYLRLSEVALRSCMLKGQSHRIEEAVRDLGRSEVFEEVSVVKHPEGSIRFTSSDKKGKTIHKDSVECKLCHENPSGPGTEAYRVERLDHGRKLLLLRAIRAENNCTARCHSGASSPVLGFVEARYSLTPLDRTLKEQKVATFVFGFILTAVCSGVLCIILWNILIKHLYTLTDAMEAVRKGNLDVKVSITSRDEIGTLAQTFNSMIEELRDARKKLENWAKELEEEVKKKTEELRRGQEQMVHTEKLASLGRLAAGVAHELNSPLTGIVTFSHLLLQRIPPERKEDREDLEVIIEQAERCSKIIKGLLGFSRAMKTEMVPLNINSTISKVLDIIRNQAKFHNIKLITDLAPELPEVVADPSQLEQVYMNLIINAADAMNDRGELRISTRKVTIEGQDFVEIEFSDTGPGIPPEHLDKIFEPFFTTKPVGKGTGLGLAVTLGIVQKHGGHIDVKSTPGKGTSFFVRLPAKKEDAEG
ncbi:MAG: HAMP domain-containing protein [Nitrospirae bacterium]|nr:MAG: HAMP domain-containing protein [Nitrospirota bacterium]